MLKNKFSLFLILFFSACVLWSEDRPLPPPPDGPFAYFSSDELEFDDAAQLLKLLGNVYVVYSDAEFGDTVFSSQNIIINLENSTLSSDGKVRVQGERGVIDAENLTGDYERRKFKIQGLSAEFPPIRILGARSAEYNDGKQKYKRARVTCCDVEDPHYYVSVGSLSVSKSKRLFATNGILYVGGVPVMYIPVFWRSMSSQKPFTTYVDFTQSNKTGFGLLTSTVFYPLKNLRATVNADYYLKSGFGYGGQLTSRDSANFKGNGEVYLIKDRENSGGENRWGTRGGYWWQINDTSDSLNKKNGAIYTSQAQFRAVSDPYFNDTFFRSNPYAFMPDQDVSVAVSRQSRAGILRLSYFQRSYFDRNEEKFVVAERTAPRVSYQLMPFNLFKTGIISHMSFDVYNTERMDSGFDQNARAVWHSSKSFRLNRTFSFVPYVFYDQSVSFKDKNYNEEDAWVGRAGGGGNLRGAFRTGDLDISYNYTKRLSTGAITSDTVSPDRGEERNSVSIQNFYRPTMYSYLRLGTGFDLQNNDESWDFKDRLEPLMAEIGVNSRGGGFNLFARNLYDVDDGNASFIFNSDFRLKGRSRMLLGMTNYETDSDRYIFQARLRLFPAKSSWGVDAGTDFSVLESKVDFFSRQIRIYKNFHDVSFVFGVEDRNDNLSFSMRFNILCGGANRESLHMIEDDIWNPWRAPGDLRD